LSLGQMGWKGFPLARILVTGACICCLILGFSPERVAVLRPLAFGGPV